MREEAENQSKPEQVRNVLSLYSLLVIFTTACAWKFYYLTKSDTFRRPLFAHIDRFSDLLLYKDKIGHLSNGAAALAEGLPVFNYPAPAAYVYKILLFSVPAHPVRLYLTFLSFCVLSLAWIAKCASAAKSPVRISTYAALITTVLIGYPLWFTADRANIEGIVWAFSAIGLCFFLKNRYWAAGILFGIAAVIKPFPVLFFLLLLRRKKFKETALGGAVGAIILIAALASLGPNPLQAYRDMQPGIARYMKKQGANLGTPEEARFEHSLLDGMKSAALLAKTRSFHTGRTVEVTSELIARPEIPRPLRTMLRVYPIIVVAFIALLIFSFYRLPILNQLTATSVSVTLFPLVSADYTLLYLYVPFGAFVIFLAREVATGRARIHVHAMTALATIYALLFAPLTFLKIYAGDAKLLLLLALLFVVSQVPMRSAYFDHLSSEP